MPNWFGLIILALASGVAHSQALSAELSVRERTKIVTRIADIIDTRYVLRDRARSVAATLRKDAADDAWRGLTDPKAFADAVSKRLQQIAKDGHLAVDYAPGHQDQGAQSAKFEAAEMERWYGAHLNHGFEKLERLPGNIGYLDLRVFAPNDMAGDVTAAAMTVLAQSDALVIDLRENGGGSGIALMAGYLFDEGAQPLSGIYDGLTMKVTPQHTPEWVPGRRYGGSKPLYVLISRKTFSAAEAFAYDLQALKRATIVGERSGGGANPFEYRALGSGFFLSLSEQLSLNPITGRNWQDVGVQPDVAVPAEHALDAALQLAREQIAKAKSKRVDSSRDR